MDRKKLKASILATFLGLIFAVVNISAQQDPEPTDQPDTHNEEIHDAGNHEETVTHEEHFDVMHHIADDHSFPLVGDYYLWLPVIIFEKGKGFDIFLSKELHHPDPQTHLVRGKYLHHHGKLSIVKFDANGEEIKDSLGLPLTKESASIMNFTSPDTFIDISITKNTFGLLLSVTILLLLFISVARAYKKRGVDTAPRGFQNAIESVILFVQNDIAIPFIGEKKYGKFMPYLLTLFFFIWINNLLGLIPIFPGGANVSGNIAFTFTLAALSLLLVFIFGRKHFWGHILWFPGVSIPLKIFLAVLELVSVVSKPFALMIRLFANITAGHILIMSIIGMTFMVKSMAGGIGIGVITSVFSALLFILELMVGAIQAYIFTLLTAQMIGAAVEEGHEHEEAHAH